MEDQNLYEYVVPENILEAKRIFGFRMRNWIEGGICAGIAGYIIASIPFVLRVKIIFLACICLPILLVNLIGVKDQSIFEAISNFIRARANRGEYHLRRPGDEERYKSGRMAKSVGSVGNGESLADKAGDFIKAKIAEFKERR